MGTITRQLTSIKVPAIAISRHMVWALVALAVFAIFVSGGIGTSPDSKAYLTIADTLVEQGHYNSWSITYPPGYPTVLALGNALGNAYLWASLVNAALFASLIYSLSHILDSVNFTGKRMVYPATMLLLIVSPLLTVALVVWTELLFITLTCVMLWLLWRYQQQPSRRVFIMIVVVAAIAPLVRYIGTMNIVTAILWIFATHWRKPITSAARSLSFGLIASTPVMSWGLRNYVKNGTLFGERVPSDYDLLTNIQRTLVTFGDWLLPAPIFVILLVVIVATVWRSRHEVRWAIVLLLSLYIVVYTTWLIISATMYHFDAIGFRLLAPVYVPFVLVMYYLLSGSLAKQKPVLGKKLALGLYWLMIVWAFANNLAYVLDRLRN